MAIPIVLQQAAALIPDDFGEDAPGLAKPPTIEISVEAPEGRESVVIANLQERMWDGGWLLHTIRVYRDSLVCVFLPRN
jgi:hypothetical protein